MIRWSCRLTMHALAASRSGSLARIVGVFADRGVSLDEVHAGIPDGLPRINLVFTADEATADALRRRLLRLPDVHEIELNR